MIFNELCEALFKQGKLSYDAVIPENEERSFTLEEFKKAANHIAEYGFQQGLQQNYSLEQILRGDE